MIGKALKIIRETQGISLSKAAAEIGCSKSFLSELESEKKAPSLKTIELFSEKFGIPASSILFFSEQLKEGEGELSFKARQFLSEKIIVIMERLSRKRTLDGPDEE